MADDVPTPAKGVYLFFEFIALGFVLVAVEIFMRGGSWRQWAGALALAAVFLFLGVAGSKIKSGLSWLVEQLRHSKALAAALAENARLKNQLSAAPATQPSRLKIYSALWGTGAPSETADVKAVLEKIPKDALAVKVTREILGCDPAEPKDKHLVVEYSYGNSIRRTTRREEYQELVLPEDEGKIERTAKEYEDRRRADVAHLEDENAALRRDLALRPTPQDLVKLQNENGDLKSRLASVPSKKWPFGDVFTIQKVSAETDVSAVYKDKVRIVLTNTTGRDLSVWTPLWESAVVFPQIPFGSRFRLEGPQGWRNADWLKDFSGQKYEEYSCLEVKAGFTVDCYIGLLQPAGKSIEERLRTRSLVGTMIFPVKIEGKLYDVSIDL